VNATLAAKRGEFEALMASGEFWELSKEERMEVSPEVHSVEVRYSRLRLTILTLSSPNPHLHVWQWLDLAAAVDGMLNSKAVAFTPVNDWMREMYGMHGIEQRDPMYATMFTLKDVEDAGRSVIFTSSSSDPHNPRNPHLILTQFSPHPHLILV